MIYCIILIFVIFSHNKLSVGFSSALKRNWWKGIGIGIDKGIGIGIAIFHPKWIGIGIERKGIGIGIGIESKKRNWPQPCKVKMTKICWKYTLGYGESAKSRPFATEIGLKKGPLQAAHPQ